MVHERTGPPVSIRRKMTEEVGHDQNARRAVIERVFVRPAQTLNFQNFNFTAPSVRGGTERLHGQTARPAKARRSEIRKTGEDRLSFLCESVVHDRCLHQPSRLAKTANCSFILRFERSAGMDDQTSVSQSQEGHVAQEIDPEGAQWKLHDCDVFAELQPAFHLVCTLVALVAGKLESQPPNSLGRFALEGQFSIAHINADGLTLAKLPFQDLQAKRIENFLLDGTLQRPCSVNRIITFAAD